MPQEGPVHLLWITENYPPSRGGMSQSCDRIIFGLRNKGINIHIIHFTNRREPFATDILFNGSYTAVPVAENEAHTANLCWNFINRMPWQFSKIVCFGGYMPMITGPVFAKWLDIPLVTLLRGNDFDASLFNPRRKTLLDEALIAAETVGCVTRDQIAKIKKLYPGLSVRYTPNGIITEDWQILPSEEKFAGTWRSEHLNGRLCLGIFGQLKEKKGIEVILECFKKPVISSKFFLLLAGDYEESLEQALQNMGIGYQLYPFMDRNELVKYYAACDAVVIPSHYEGMPNVLLESGALGKVVIASAVGGMKDVLSEADESLLFYPGDHRQLETLIIGLSEMSAEERMEKGRKLRDHIYNYYNSENELKPYVEIFSFEKDHRKTLV